MKGYSTEHLYDYNIRKAWKKDETIQMVKKHLALTYLPISFKSFENHGNYYDVNAKPSIYHQKEIKDGRKEYNIDKCKLLPRKGEKHPLNNVFRYGGYGGINTAYFMIIEHLFKKEIIREFEIISIFEKKTWEKLSEEDKLKRLSLKYKNPRIICPKILVGTLFEIGPMQAYLTGTNGVSKVLFQNARQMFFDEESTRYIKLITKLAFLIEKKVINQDDYLESDEFVISKHKVLDEVNEKIIEKKVTKKDNISLWNMLLAKIYNLYEKRSEGLKNKSLGIPDLYGKLSLNQNKFMELPLLKQVALLNSIIQGLSCKPVAFDLSMLGLGEHVSAIQPNLKIKYPLVMVEKSVTGLKEKRTRIYPFK